MTSKPFDQNFYDLLEVPRTAAHHEIVEAYQRAKEAYAPDSPALYTMFSKEEAAELRRLVEEAFMVLGNQTKRREYDNILLARENKFEGTATVQSPQASRDKVTQPSSAIPAPAGTSGPLPDGFARSRLSVYEVRPEIENEIAQQKSFDGAFLRKVRQYKGIHIDQLSKETRISRSYLVAIEAEDYEGLPAPVFVRGFLVQIARTLALNENLVANSYMSRFHNSKS